MIPQIVRVACPTAPPTALPSDLALSKSDGHEHTSPERWIGDDHGIVPTTDARVRLGHSEQIPTPHPTIRPILEKAGARDRIAGLDHPGEAPMPRKCQITGKKPLSGHNVSHAHNLTNKWQRPNLHKKKIWVAELGRSVRLKVSTRAMRTIDKKGLVPYLKDNGLTLDDVT